ncbi:MAG: GTP-binding protein [Paludibacteraceae bacterium]|nr:GTP-binding protein [Paludibacteraceae bacterium]
MNKQVVPIMLLTGYLGSGKTTLVNNILSNNKGYRFAVIVNDIGEVNIDASLIQKGGIVTEEQNNLVALSNGCICCSLQTDLLEQIAELTKSNQFDYIVIEASGVCDPFPIAQTIASTSDYAKKYQLPEICRLDCVVTVVDALRILEEFSGGNDLLGLVDEECIASLLVQQIEFCNVIVLNKISEVTIEAKNELLAVLKKLQPEAQVIEADFAQFDLNLILDTHAFDLGKVAMSAGWIKSLDEEVECSDTSGHCHCGCNHEHPDHHENHLNCEHHDHSHCHHHHQGEGESGEYGISTFVYYRRRAFNLSKFEQFVYSNWPKGVIRSKGILYFEENEPMSYMFDQAGSLKRLTEAGQWICTAPQEEVEHLLERNADLRRDWDAEYGDKMIKIVFIGKDMERQAIIDTLNKI